LRSVSRHSIVQRGGEEAKSSSMDSPGIQTVDKADIPCLCLAFQYAEVRRNEMLGAAVFRRGASSCMQHTHASPTTRELCQSTIYLGSRATRSRALTGDVKALLWGICAGKDFRDGTVVLLS
jgi:hypothetical protein